MNILAKIKIYHEELDQVLLGLAKAGYPVTAEIDYGKDGNHTDGWWIKIYDKPGLSMASDYTTTDIPIYKPQYYVGTDPETLKGGASSF